MSDQQAKIAKVLAAHRGERHLIVLHDFPDPDAISAGYAHQLISAGYEIEADIIYNGRISHQQNIAMVRMLGIRLQRFEPELGFNQYQGAIFVDNQGANAGKVADALETAGVPPLIIVDHHERQERLAPEFSDIRPEAGSSATIYAEYLEQEVITLDKSVREHVIAATALLLGIKTDTLELTRARAADFQAAAYLSQYSDADLLSQIMSQSRSRQVMEVIRIALENRVIAESYSIAGIGYLRSEDRDAIPQVADFLLTEENIHTVIVYGIVRNDEDEELLVGSLRTSKITIDPDSFIKETFGTDSSGQYFGGGKMSAGAFEIPIGFLTGESSNAEYQQLKWQVYDLQVKQSIFAKTGIKRE